jgi:hypothetical protein
MLQANAACREDYFSEVAGIKTKMRLSKTLIHENQLGANRSAPQQESAQLVLDTANRFMMALHNRRASGPEF